MLASSSKSFLVLAILLIIPVGVSAQLVCCAGMASMGSMDMDDGGGCSEGMGCCDKAHDDAIARHCCDGGERLDRSHSLPQTSAAPAVVLPAAPTVSGLSFGGVGWSTLGPAKSTDLFTLHSAFLI